MVSIIFKPRNLIHITSQGQACLTPHPHLLHALMLTVLPSCHASDNQSPRSMFKHLMILVPKLLYSRPFYMTLPVIHKQASGRRRDLSLPANPSQVPSVFLYLMTPTLVLLRTGCGICDQLRYFPNRNCLALVP